MTQLAIHRYSASLVTQGRHKFYSLTVPSDVLGETTYVRAADEDPDVGFQRTLDERRAQQIAEYVDSGLGTIPTSIILSAQPEAQLRFVDGGKTLEFKGHRKAFLIIDGQHRVFGFKLANTRLRVPVVIYNNLTASEEAKLFIDINTKQRPVPPELLLHIKKMAEYEKGSEKLFNEVFDLFATDTKSPLQGDMSARSKRRGAISRVTFHAALKPISSAFGTGDSATVYGALRGYVEAFRAGCGEVSDDKLFLNPIVFRASLLLFPEVARIVRSRKQEFNTDNFYDVLQPLFQKLSVAKLKKPGKSPAELYSDFSKALRNTFSILD